MLVTESSNPILSQHRDPRPPTGNPRLRQIQMAPRTRIIRQFEVGAGCVLAWIGLMMCMQTHWAKSTHIGEFGTRTPAPWVIDAPWWVIDGMWLLGLLVAAVVGFRGGFLGSKLTAVAAFLILLSSVTPSGIPFDPLILLALGAFHLLAIPIVGLRLYLARGRANRPNGLPNEIPS